MTDARIGVIRDAMLMGYGLFMADAQIRELLAALDKIGVPLPAAQTLTLGEMTQRLQGPDEWLLDLLSDAKVQSESQQPLSPGCWEQTR